MDWRTVFFSDEKKFNFDGPDRNMKVWVKEGESKENFFLYRRQQGGGLVMCWVGFCYTFKGPLFFFNGTVNADSYVKHLKNNFLPWYIEQNFKPVYFQHDNAPPHVSQVTKKSLVEWGLDVLKWPANSPDLNPVENLWKLLSDAVYVNGKQYT